MLARGERPTVERVRLELGRGSPVRVGSLLDQWWARLAERLSGETRLPTLPGEVSQAFVFVWQQAIHLAQGIAEQALAEQRQVLIADRRTRTGGGSREPSASGRGAISPAGGRSRGRAPSGRGAPGGSGIVTVPAPAADRGPATAA